MKKYGLIVAALVIGLFVGTKFLSASESPYPDWFANFFSNEGVRNSVNYNNNIVPQRLAHGVYDFSVQGGGTVGTAIPLQITLPAKAVVSRVYYYVTTAITGPGPTNFAQLGCIQSSGAAGATMKAATDFTLGAATFVEGIPTGSAATMITSTTSCPVGLQVTSNTLTAGKVDFYINYSVSQ